MSRLDPPGVWREELICGGGCGYGLITGKTAELPAAIKLGPKCKGVFMGRLRNRCGWPMSRVWVFVPKETL